MDTVQVVLLIVLAAAVGEGINEFFFLPWFDRLKDEAEKEDPEQEKKRKWRETVRVQLMRLWSGLVGVFISWELNLLVFSLLGAHLRHPLVENVLVGLLIGRGSNWVHEFLKKFALSVKAKQLLPETSSESQTV